MSCGFDLSANYHDTLYRYISPEQLPVCYGGKRTDPDGNPTCWSQVYLLEFYPCIEIMVILEYKW